MDLKSQNFIKKTTRNSRVMRHGGPGLKPKTSSVEARGMDVFCKNLLDSLVPTNIHVHVIK